MADEPWAHSRWDLRLAQSPGAPETAEFNDPRADFGWLYSYETGLIPCLTQLRPERKLTLVVTPERRVLRWRR